MSPGPRGNRIDTYLELVELAHGRHGHAGVFRCTGLFEGLGPVGEGRGWSVAGLGFEDFCDAVGGAMPRFFPHPHVSSIRSMS